MYRSVNYILVGLLSLIFGTLAPVTKPMLVVGVLLMLVGIMHGSTYCPGIVNEVYLSLASLLCLMYKRVLVASWRWCGHYIHHSITSDLICCIEIRQVNEGDLAISYEDAVRMRASGLLWIPAGYLYLWCVRLSWWAASGWFVQPSRCVYQYKGDMF